MLCGNNRNWAIAKLGKWDFQGEIQGKFKITCQPFSLFLFLSSSLPLSFPLSFLTAQIQHSGSPRSTTQTLIKECKIILFWFPLLLFQNYSFFSYYSTESTSRYFKIFLCFSLGRLWKNWNTRKKLELAKKNHEKN